MPRLRQHQPASRAKHPRSCYILRLHQCHCLQYETRRWTSMFKHRHDGMTAARVKHCMTNFTGSTSPTGVFQAGSDSSPVSERPHTAIPIGLLRSGRRCRHSAAPAFSQPPTACSTLLPAQHLRPSGLFSCWPQSLELSLPDFIWNPTISADCFRRLLKTYLFARY